MTAGTPETEPHGDVRYYYDGIQQLIGVLPRTCRTRGHDLHLVGYDHHYVERPGAHRLILVRCRACHPPDDCWILVQPKARVFKAELDDHWYSDLRKLIREPYVD